MAKLFGKCRKFWSDLGPGLVAGAADNDPSGIVTYSVAGAKFGLAALWTVWATLPFMIITQRMAGRIGLISGKGFIGNMRNNYSRWLLVLVCILILTANTINIGADISAMSATITILSPNISPIFFTLLIPLFLVVFLIFLSFHQLIKYFKWIALVMLAYVAAPFFISQEWSYIFTRFFVPDIQFSKEYLMIVVAVFGTTISPYLFFWQASEAVEEKEIKEKENFGKNKVSEKILLKNGISTMYADVKYGMIFSNIITFFIIILNASTIFRFGGKEINTVSDVASALGPLAGTHANLLFLVGILASGILAIPVLAGSAAYAVSELFNWKWGLEKKFHRAPQFYLIIIISTIIGTLIPVFNLHPVKILVYTAMIYGVISPVLIALLIHMANNPKIMGKYTSRVHSNVIAYVLLLIMTASLILLAVL